MSRLRRQRGRTRPGCSGQYYRGAAHPSHAGGPSNAGGPDQAANTTRPGPAAAKSHKATPQGTAADRRDRLRRPKPARPTSSSGGMPVGPGTRPGVQTRRRRVQTRRRRRIPRNGWRPGPAIRAVWRYQRHPAGWANGTLTIEIVGPAAGAGPGQLRRVARCA